MFFLTLLHSKQPNSREFWLFECKRVNVVKVNGYTSRESNSAVFILLPSISFGDNSLGKEFAFLEVNAIL